MKQAAVVIPSFNAADQVIHLVKKLRQAEKIAKKVKLTIIVVDNASKNDALEKIRSENPKGIDLIFENDENLGFAKAVNIGLRIIQTKFKNRPDAIVLLNQDTDPDKRFLLPLISNKADIVSPVIRFKKDDTYVYDYGGKINWLLGRPYHIESVTYPSYNFPQKDIEFVSGCCICLKKITTQTVGLFDENYFLYFEDVDYCLRARRLGFKIAIETKSLITHYLMPGNKKSLTLQNTLLQSNLRFILNWVPFVFKPPALLYLLWLKLKRV